MAKRITIMLDDDMDRKLRIKQSDLIRKTQKSISFSKVINEALRGKIKL